VTQGGYSWLSITDGGMTYHPGVDLNAGGSCNADEGLAVVAPLAGVVRSTLYAASGEGNHLWFEIDDPCCPGPTWLHLDHLQRIDAAVGGRVPAGGNLGTCGRTGGWDCAHLHTEFVQGKPANGYWQWPYGWSRAQVEDAYWQPLVWWNAASALALAEGGRPPPEEVVMAMSDWELKHWVLGTLYEWAGIEFNPESGIAQAWVDATRAGAYPGRPRTGERPFGAPVSGVWQECEQQLLIWKNDGTTSWRG
jgi:murein DD-endopeptidase MepM/ murein hydrolase activator NlpD